MLATAEELIKQKLTLVPALPEGELALDAEYARRAIYVFGSNLAGMHGRGSAVVAKKEYGAAYGVGVGRTGNAYAIPTKNVDLKVLSLHSIAAYVDDFIMYATNHPYDAFLVTRVGCGLAGYTDEQIAPLFAEAPSNCILPRGWYTYLWVGN